MPVPVLCLFHLKGIIHRDLKPKNILINEDFHLKIADFRIACRETYCDLLVDDPGTYRWMAPEMIKTEKLTYMAWTHSMGNGGWNHSL
ncbi:hypothetical protein FXO38_32687 [Capsicum annuum]|uniref:Protein kinase domain-containing protein n=1 Tax=Capsicum annuum TaxID=4072 RepID=A0A2G2ZYE9_CAPAN|nr:hypothetical protein FXO38_32687 [Capsicum annuum]KAF3681829.1 hypothetical protein FXO37_02681 [Capsicum annuum]PHT87017.1 hypothetical protein T459_09123 [Capsicum annuum]